MRFDVKFRELGARFTPVFRDLQVVTVRPDVEYYEGAYNVTPKTSAQTLPTKEKYLTDDVNVEAIPIYETSNSSGGTTVYIAQVKKD